jgi:hypothetical protein
MKRAAAILSFFVMPFAVAGELAPPAIQTAVQQLRQAAGRWTVTTTQYDSSGSVKAVASGTWQFDWVVPDRVLAGRASIPDWKQSTGILLYLNERRSTVEMATVGADGQLQVLAGAAGTDTRTSAAVALPDGRRMVKRYTRYRVEADRFESCLETSYDGGRSWQPGLHHLFVRAPEERPDSGAKLRYRKRSRPYVPLT